MTSSHPIRCCQGTGLADFAAIPCPNPECTALPTSDWYAFALTPDEVGCLGVALTALKRQMRHMLTIDDDPKRSAQWNKLFREATALMIRFGINDLVTSEWGVYPNERPVSLGLPPKAQRRNGPGSR